MCRRQLLRERLVSGLMMFHVLLVDDTRLHRDGLVEVLERAPNIAGVAGTTDAAAALRLLGIRAFDVILVSLTMADGIAICRQLVMSAPRARVVAFAVSVRDDEIVACAEAGVAGYVLRDQSHAELIDVLARVAHGETVCPPQITAALLRRVASLGAERHERGNGGDSARLTPRENQILGLIDQGLSNKEIARRLSIEVRTVKNHVHNLLEKLKVHRRGEAAALVRRNSLNGHPPLA